MRPQSVSSMPLQRGRLITDRLNDRDRHPAECRGEARVPSLGVPLVAVRLQHDEPRNRFDGHQTYLGMKRLIFADRDLASRHLRRQPLLLGAAIFVDLLGHAGRIRLLGTI